MTIMVLQLLDLEGGRDVDDVALRRQHGRMHALGAAEVEPGEVDHARRDIEIERVDALLAHDRLRAGDAPQSLLDADRRHVAAHRASSPQAPSRRSSRPRRSSCPCSFLASVAAERDDASIWQAAARAAPIESFYAPLVPVGLCRAVIVRCFTIHFDRPAAVKKSARRKGGHVVGSPRKYEMRWV